MVSLSLLNHLQLLYAEKSNLMEKSEVKQIQLYRNVDLVLKLVLNMNLTNNTKTAN